MNKSESIASLAAALAKAQSEIENAHKTSNNPHFKSRYADLAEVINTVRPVFTSHGLAVTQMPSFDAGIASVETMLMHSSGEWISSVSSAPVTKQDAQGVGSAITYLRRYSLAAVAGVAQEDEDANPAANISQRKLPVITEALTNEAMLAVAQIQACEDLKTLGEVWAELPVDVKKLCTKAKDDKKKELS